MFSSGSVAVVTGSGARRIGWHVARALAERGCRIVMHYRSSKEEAEKTVAEWGEMGVDCLAVGADLRRGEDVDRLVASAVERFGRIDGCVHCAAIWEPRRLEETTAEDVVRHFESNLLATYLVMQKVGLAMVGQAEGGSIVALGDWAEARPYLDYSAYFATKSAIPGLTRTMAVELGTRNPHVRVNAVLPGPVTLPASLPDEERRAAVEATLVKREGSPADVVQAVLHFLDNTFVTGTSLPVDGGRTIFAPASAESWRRAH